MAPAIRCNTLCVPSTRSPQPLAQMESYSLNSGLRNSSLWKSKLKMEGQTFSSKFLIGCCNRQGPTARRRATGTIASFGSALNDNHRKQTQRSSHSSEFVNSVEPAELDPRIRELKSPNASHNGVDDWISPFSDDVEAEEARTRRQGVLDAQKIEVDVDVFDLNPASSWSFKDEPQQQPDEDLNRRFKLRDGREVTEALAFKCEIRPFSILLWESHTQIIRPCFKGIKLLGSTTVCFRHFII